jgi:aarF domain-containing kinase
LFLLTTFGF